MSRMLERVRGREREVRESKTGTDRERDNEKARNRL